ncbi:hypothetical protein M9Y10_018153 [Tritrichomonas musculus]|uniref:Ankyrin repeat protein n=1 Tax=Tritrichomonas musculus TaxID=1915356 RepID=A0ABR2HNS0_9EUKA
MDKVSIQRAWEATRYDDLSTLETYVKTKEDANSKIISDKNHCHSLLMAAAAHGALQCAEYLIKQGADVNMKNFHGFTAIHWAGFTGRTNVIPLLIQNGADIESRTADGKTPIHIASFRGQKSFVDFILKNCNADINSVDAEGRNALFYAVSANQKATAEYLLQNNISIGQCDAHHKNVTEFANNPSHKWFSDLLQKLELL